METIYNQPNPFKLLSIKEIEEQFLDTNEEDSFSIFMDSEESKKPYWPQLENGFDDNIMRKMVKDWNKKFGTKVQYIQDETRFEPKGADQWIYLYSYIYYLNYGND